MKEKAGIKKVTIDTEAFAKWVDGMPLSYVEIGDRIGKSRSYISIVKRDGEMPEKVYRLMLNVFSLPEGSFLKQPEPEPEPEQIEIPTEPEKPVTQREGYWIDLQALSDKVCVRLMFSAAGADVEVVHAWSMVRGNDELAIIKAISYATHMCYKFAEQRKIGK